MKPIPIIRTRGEFTPTAQEYLAFQKQKHDQRVQWVFLGFLLTAIGGLLLPLVLWLSRIALGN